MRPTVTKLATLLAVLLLAPLAAEAQQAGKEYRIGVLFGGSDAALDSLGFPAFRQALHNLGWVEGRNIVFDLRLSGDQPERLPELADDLVKRNVDLIMASPTTGALAAKQATSKIPIVVGVSIDLVGAGVVTNLPHPGGNITGLTMMSGDLIGKRLQLLKEIAPGVSRLVFLRPPRRPGNQQIIGPLYEQLQSAGRSLGLTVPAVELDGVDVGRAFKDIADAKAQALYVLEAPTIIPVARRIMDQAVRHQLPTVVGLRDYAEAGALLSYGPNLPDLYRRAATYVDKILKGAKPGDLPVEQPTRFDLIINMKTAKALGLTVRSRRRCCCARIS